MASRIQPLAASSLQHVALRDVKGRRDAFEILTALLEILLESGAASKTRLMNQANLNPMSFRRYISMLVRSGAVTVTNGSENRTVYAVTPRARILYHMLLNVLEALYVDEDIVRRYLRIYEYVSRIAEEAGCRPSLGLDEPPYIDLVLECNRRKLRLMFVVEGDPLYEYKIMLLRSSNDDSVYLVGEREGEGVLSPEGLRRLLLSCSSG